MEPSWLRQQFRPPDIGAGHLMGTSSARVAGLNWDPSHSLLTDERLLCADLRQIRAFMCGIVTRTASSAFVMRRFATWRSCTDVFTNALLMRVCQPGPLMRKNQRTSGARRRGIESVFAVTFGLAFHSSARIARNAAGSRTSTRSPRHW
jgi:hypothetical protein